MWGIWVALIGAALASGSAPKNQPKAAAQQQTEASQPQSSTKQKPPSGGGESAGCPGTSTPQSTCDGVTAKATERQADLMDDSNWLSLFTIAVAGFAAAFAWSAARAGSKSYEAFVAAEDAHLVLDFPAVSVIQQYSPEGDGEWHNLYRITAKITNVGRSTALIRSVHADGKFAAASQTLKRDGEWSLDDRIERETTDPFEVVIKYTSPITDRGKLCVKGEVFSIGKRAWGVVTSSKLSKEPGTSWWQRIWSRIRRARQANS